MSLTLNILLLVLLIATAATAIMLRYLLAAAVVFSAYSLIMAILWTELRAPDLALTEAAVREFCEETGLQTEVTELLHVSEVILPERPYHSITISFSGRVTGGELRAEGHHPYGEKEPRWLSTAELKGVKYHPEQTVEKALGIKVV